jgi:hypothetical protein
VNGGVIRFVFAWGLVIATAVWADPGDAREHVIAKIDPPEVDFSVGSSVIACMATILATNYRLIRSPLLDFQYNEDKISLMVYRVRDDHGLAR